jgi:hypothetical protein
MPMNATPAKKTPIGDSASPILDQRSSVLWSARSNRIVGTGDLPSPVSHCQQSAFTLGDSCLWACSRWKRTSAAATMPPIFQGHLLTFRSALNRILSWAFACSARARSAPWTLLYWI